MIRRLLRLRGVVELGAQIRDLFRSQVRRVFPRRLRRRGVLLRGGELALEVVERLRGVPLLHLGSGKILSRASAAWDASAAACSAFNSAAAA